MSPPSGVGSSLIPKGPCPHWISMLSVARCRLHKSSRNREPRRYAGNRGGTCFSSIDSSAAPPYHARGCLVSSLSLPRTYALGRSSSATMDYFASLGLPRKRILARDLRKKPTSTNPQPYRKDPKPCHAETNQVIPTNRNARQPISKRATNNAAYRTMKRKSARGRR